MSDLSPSHTVSLVYTLAMLATFVVALLWAGRRALAGQPLALWCVVAGTIMVLIEPLLDYLSVFTYSEDNVAVVFHAFDVPIPLLAIVGYGFYFGAEAYLGFQFIARGAGREQLWRLFALAWVLDAVLEGIAVQSDLFAYSAAHPMDPWGQPLWFPFVNAAFPVVCGVVLHALRNVLVGARGALVIPLSAFLFSAVYVGTAWPAFMSMHADVSDAVRWIAALATIGLALGVTHGAIRLMEWLRTVQAPDTPPVQQTAVLA